MTLEEAIKHAEEVANTNERLCETVQPAMQLSDYGKCAEEHRQLAEWLKDYMRLLEQEPCEDSVSRSVFDQVRRERDVAIEQLKELGYQFGEKIRTDEDAISRQALLDAFDFSEKTRKWGGDHSGYNTMMLYEIQNMIESAPSVTPQPKYEDIAKAFQFGLAFGFGEKHDEMDKVIDEIKKVATPQPKTGHYEKHIDHTDCIWYGSDSGCPVTCSQYRDGWNDAMDYIFKNGKGYQPYRHDDLATGKEK